MCILRDIDRQQHSLPVVLGDLLSHKIGKSLDVAAADFAISDYRLVR